MALCELEFTTCLAARLAFFAGWPRTASPTIMSQASSRIWRPSFLLSPEGAFETRNDSIPGPGAKGSEIILQRSQSRDRRIAGSHRVGLVLRLHVRRAKRQGGDEQSAGADNRSGRERHFPGAHHPTR